MVSGCTPWDEYKANGFKVGPNYCKPHADVADQWIDAADKRMSTEEPDLSHWWTAFNDPQLTDLIECAANQNLTLKEACFRILQERSALAIAVGNLLPQTQQAVGSYSRNSISTLAANQQLLPDRFFNNWNLGFNLSWELDFWGRFRRAIESAQADLNASVFDYDDVLVTLLGDVGTTYIQIRTLQQQIAYVKENIKIQKEALDIAQARFNGGLTSELDTEQAISQLAQTQALIPQYEKQLRAANDRLCVLEGIPTKDLVPDLGDKPIPPVAADVVVGIPCDLLCRRPDVRRAEQLAASQSAQIGVAEAQLYPAIAVTGTVGFDAQRFTGLFKDRSFQSSIGPGFQWNVLNYGRLINNVQLNAAKFCELVNAYRQTILQANAEAEDGIVEFLQSQLQEKELARSVTAADKAVKLAITQYQGGLVDFNRVALLEQDLVQQQNLLAEAEGDIDTGLVHLYRALGGGWDYSCPDEAAGLAQPPTVEGNPPASSEELPQGNGSPRTPGFGATPGPDMKSTPSPDTKSNPIPPYQQPPGGNSSPLQLPGPSNTMPPPPVPGSRSNGPQARSVVRRFAVDQKPAQIRHSDDDFDWTKDDGLLPLRFLNSPVAKSSLPKPTLTPPATNINSAQAQKHEVAENFPIEAETSAESSIAENASPPILHAGLIQGDCSQLRLRR
ncbi:MAG TPA: efflux transporter outer membrane subunit [Pirellulales bacterium]|nr:efflux transporter outer membrane subunit [Pirellulales bacterium]